MDFSIYMSENTLILIPVLYVLGMFLKGTPKAADWFIPWALLSGGVLGGTAIFGFNANGVFQGFLAAGAAVFGNQLLKQTIKGIEGVDDGHNDNC